MEFDYEELAEKIANNEKVSEDEYQFVINEIIKKLRAGVELDGVEMHIIYDDSYYDMQYIESAKHGWIYALIIIKIDEDEFYGFKAYYHDDYGIDDFTDGVYRRVGLKEVIEYKWCEVE